MESEEPTFETLGTYFNLMSHIRKEIFIQRKINLEYKFMSKIEIFESMLEEEKRKFNEFLKPINEKNLQYISFTDIDVILIVETESYTIRSVYFFRNETNETNETNNFKVHSPSEIVKQILEIIL